MFVCREYEKFCDRIVLQSLFYKSLFNIYIKFISTIVKTNQIAANVLSKYCVLFVQEMIEYCKYSYLLAILHNSGLCTSSYIYTLYIGYRLIL
jgi:hypothetical protein